MHPSRHTLLRSTPLLAAAAFALGTISMGAGSAQQAPLFQTLSNCVTGQRDSNVPQDGFAIINAHVDTISAEVHLQNAPANAVYAVSLDQTPSSSGCVVPLGTLTTNGQGNGNFHIEVPRISGTADAFVILRPANAAALATGEIDSADVVFGAP